MKPLKILRLRLEVETRLTDADQSQAPGWKISYVPVLSDGSDLAPLPLNWPKPRYVGVQVSGARNFPKLPIDENWISPSNLPAGVEPTLRNHCTGTNPAELEMLYERIVQRQQVAENHDVSTFGRYLFEVLIGRVAWNGIRAWAAEQTADILEIALAWGPEETHLHRLNWEMMYGPDGFLAARQPHAPHRVVITRMVTAANFKPAQVQEVPRYLCVIGAPSTDPGIRPGAELLGLLRGLEVQNRSIHPRVLSGAENKGATPGELLKQMKSFSPHVVHFICHGNFDDAGGAALALRPDPNDPSQKRDFDTQAIFELLSRGSALPGMVVLSACNTGQVGGTVQLQPAVLKGGYETAPMAAGLVRRGIPVVVGMAGQVTDSACRHFTRRFGQAILACEPLVVAAAEGRWAAFAYGQSVEASVDWAFPALFLAESVPPNFTPLQSSTDTQYAQIETWIQNFTLKAPKNEAPGFCGRDEFFDAFYRLFEPEPPAVLAVYVEAGQGYGKSRLLEELAMAAIREGHVPLVLIHTKNNDDYPKDLESLRTVLVEKLKQATDTYTSTGPAGNSTQPPLWQLGILAADRRGPGLSANIQRELSESGGFLTGRALALALREDLLALSDFVGQQHPFIKELSSRPVLMLDDVHLFGPDFLRSWFGDTVLGGFGLGRDSATRIPVVMTYSLDGSGGSAGREILPNPERPKGKSLRWMKLLKLGNFSQEKDQDLLVYEQIWLNPFNPELYKGDDYECSSRSLALAAEPVKGPKWDRWLAGLRSGVGFPQRLTNDIFYILAASGMSDKFLEAADDRKMLEDYMKQVSNADS